MIDNQVIYLNEALDTAVFYGVNNSNMVVLKNLHPSLHIVARGHVIKVSGAEDEVDRFEARLHALEDFCVQHNVLTENHIIDIVKGNQPQEFRHDNLILHGVNGKAIIARTPNQQRLVTDFQTNDLLFAIGPAGSGKTYTAIALAVRALKNREVRKIILSRPAVEAGEKLGFLPGDMKEKIDPYLQPLYDALEDMIPAAKLQDYMEHSVIQIAPLAFMRGRTLSDAVVILDEAQNTTSQQIKMFLTRLGMNSKMIVTGDITQIDLPATQKSGLKDAVEKLSAIKGVSINYFDQRDIIRHPLVQRIVDAYDKSEKQKI